MNNFNIHRHSDPTKALVVHRRSLLGRLAHKLLRKIPSDATKQIESMHAALEKVASQAPLSNEAARLQHHLRNMMGWEVPR